MNASARRATYIHGEDFLRANPLGEPVTGSVFRSCYSLHQHGIIAVVQTSPIADSYHRASVVCTPTSYLRAQALPGELACRSSQNNKVRSFQAVRWPQVGRIDPRPVLLTEGNCFARFASPAISPKRFELKLRRWHHVVLLRFSGLAFQSYVA